MESSKLIHEGFLFLSSEKVLDTHVTCQERCTSRLCLGCGPSPFWGGCGLLVLESPRMSLWASLSAALQAAAVLPGCTDGIEGFLFRGRGRNRFRSPVLLVRSAVLQG